MRKALTLILAAAIGYVTSAITIMVWAGRKLYEELYAD